MNTRQQAEHVAQQNLQQCAADVLTWRTTGKLPSDAYLHKVAAVWDATDLADDSLQQAEHTVVKLVLQQAAAGRPNT